MPTAILRPTAIALRDAEKLQFLHPPFAAFLRELLNAMETIGYPMTVWEGLRTAETQFGHFQKGRRQGQPGEPGAQWTSGHGIWVPIDPVHRTGIVTNADGGVKKSNHQAAADGKGRAADCVFLIDGADADTELDDPTWDESRPWGVYGALGEHLGGSHVRWLGRSPSLRDMPHFEWLAD